MVASGRVPTYHRAVCARNLADIGLRVAIAGASVTAVLALPVMAPSSGIPTASASCPQVQVVFARGRLEQPGLGVLGNAFVSALQSKVPNKDITAYAVRYPADTQVDVGANDMSHHVQDMVNNCPDTRLVLGGYSLGAAVTDVVVAVAALVVVAVVPVAAVADVVRTPAPVLLNTPPCRTILLLPWLQVPALETALPAPR